MGRKSFFKFFSYKEKHFTKLWISVSYFTLEANVGCCSAKEGALYQAFLKCGSPEPQDLWKVTVKDIIFV